MSAATTTTLPAQLSPWAPWLEGLAADVQSWLLKSLAQLQVLLPNAGVASPAAAGEFAGYAGLQSRGRFERLLMSEWLYADELPDEFLRRASSGEQLFLAPALEHPARSRALVVLFDAGPAQLGGCRLAHLALWVLLARRAQASGWRWRWGCLQQPQPLDERSDATALNSLMSARSLQLVDATLEQQWHALLAPLEVAELWLVGGDTAVAPSLGGFQRRCISVREPLRLDPRVLQLGSPSARIELALPDAVFAARLLRNPLGPDVGARPRAGRSKAPVSSFARKQAPLFTADGRRVAVRMLDDSTRIVVIPNSPQDPRGKVHTLPTDASTVALGIGPGRKSGCQVKVVDGQLRFFRAFGFSDPITVYFAADFQQVALAPGVRSWCPLWAVGDQVLLLDQRQRLHLFACDFHTREMSHRVLAEHVIGQLISESGWRFDYAHARKGMIMFEHWPAGKAAPPATPKLHHICRRALFGEVLRETSTALVTARELFIELSAQNWSRIRSQHVSIQVPADESVLGCWGGQLVCAAARRKQFILRGTEGTTPIEIGHEMLAPSLSPEAGILAWFNHDHELLLYSLPRRCIVYRLRGDAA